MTPSRKRAADPDPIETAPLRDEVDSVVEAWTEAHPDLDLTPLHVFSRIDRIAQLLDRHRRRTFQAHDLEPWELDVLAALRRAGAPYRLSPGRLLRETHVTSGTMTNRVDRLVAKGLVHRAQDPSDGRGVLVELTDDGLHLVDRALAALVDLEAGLLGEWSCDERGDLAAYLRRLLLDSDPS